jgi:nicotinic acid mononucleotide adenylyltransferase
MGSDAFFDLMNGKWKDSHRILQMLQNRLLVLYRNDDIINYTNNSNEVTASPFDVDNKLKCIQDCIKNRCPGATLLQVSHLDAISSTLVRQCVDVDVLQTMISLPVLQYMQKNHLYQFSNTQDY